MANNDATQQIDDNVQDAEIVMVKAAGAARQKLLWPALAVVLIAVLVAGWWLHQQQQQAQQKQQQQWQQMSSETQTLTTTMQHSQQQLASLEQSQQQLSKQLEELLAKQEYSSDELLRQWSLQEVQYLLNIANQRALLAHDVAGAQKALLLADQKLEAVNDYRLHPLRALIAEENMALEALADVDIAGMAIQLQTAANHVDKLRVVKGPEISLDETAVPGPQATDSNWQQALSDIWQQLRSLVVIRHDQSGEAAVLVPEQRYFLYQNLKLQLESARLALLNGDASSYQHSLQTAIDWLNRYFTGDERDAMLNSLQALKGSNIDISVPDISASLKWLEGFEQ